MVSTQNAVMKTMLATFVGLVAVGALTLAEETGDKKVKMQDLPSPVQEAVKEQSKGATLQGLATEVEDLESVKEGTSTAYEAQIEKAGKKYEVKVDAAGKVVK
jgi:uncharacterized membrane protein YkoI